MKAYCARVYGKPDVLTLEDVPSPAPGDHDVLVRIHATSVNSGDVRLRGRDFPKGMVTIARLIFGWYGPRQPILGTEFSGIVEAVGPEVKQFAPGDRVFGFPGGKMGAHAELIVLPESGPIAHLPKNLSLVEGAGLSFGGTTALHFLRAAKPQPGETMLVIGATGTVGFAIAQLARHQGLRVTAATSTANLALLAQWGFHDTMDYRAQPLSESGRRFDIIADTANALGFAKAQKLLNPNGRYLAIAGAFGEMLGSLVPGADGKRMIASPAEEKPADIRTLASLAEQSIYAPLVDQVFAFEHMVEAHKRVESRRKRGTVIVEIVPALDP